MAFQPAFVWGQGGQRMTPEEIARQRQIVDALMGKTDTSPVAHWTQGAARLVDALGTRLDENRLNNAEEQNTETNRDLMSALMGGIGGGSASSVASSPSVASALTAGPTETPAGQAINSRVASAHGDDLTAYQDAIASIESAGSGDYSAVGPTHPELGRALGRYQVMEANVGPWSEAALGYSVTPEEFMASPEIQDAIFNHQFGQYVNQYGPEGAAQAWFGGPGGVGQTNRSDSLGTTIGEYGQKFNAALGGLPENPSHGQIVRGPDGQLYQNVEQLDGSWDWSRRAENFGAAQQPVQVAQAGGINPAIVQALTSPYADDSTRQMASILLEQQLQANDPGRQLEMEIQREKLNQLRNPRPETTAEMQNLQWRAAQAGLQPGTQEYTDFMLSGGRGPETVVNVGNGAPELGKLSTDYGYVLDPATGQPVIDPQTGLPRAAPVPGSAAAQEIEQRQAARERTGNKTDRTAGIVQQDIDRALAILDDDSTLPTTGAIGDLLSGVGSTAARDLRGLLDTVKANAGFAELQAMRDNSPTGGALGQVTERELAFLQATIGNLEQSQTEDQLRDNLNRVYNTYLDIVHGEGNGPDRRSLSFQQPTQPETLEIDRNTVPEGVDPEDWKYMSEEDRALFR